MIIEDHPTPVPAPLRTYTPPRGRPVPGWPGLTATWVRSLTAPHGLSVLVRGPGRPDVHRTLDELNAAAAGYGREAALARAILAGVEGGAR